MRVSIARCALVALTMVGFVGCSSSGGSSGLSSWNPFRSREVAQTPAKPSAFATPSSTTSSSAPEQIASVDRSSTTNSAYPGAPTSYSAALDSLTKGSKSGTGDTPTNPYAAPQSGYYNPSAYAATGTTSNLGTASGSGDAGTTSRPYGTTASSYAASPSYPSTASTAGWGAASGSDVSRFAPAAERYGNPSSYANTSTNSASPTAYGTTSPPAASSTAPYAYTAANTSAYGGAAGSGYQPAQNGYQPGATGYTPGSSDYTPGNSSYSPGSTGYNPAGSSYQSPAAPYQSPAGQYQSPSGAYQSPSGTYPSTPYGPVSSAGGTAPEFRPGSTKSLPQGSTGFPGSTVSGPYGSPSQGPVTPVGYTTEPSGSVQ